MSKSLEIQYIPAIWGKVDPNLKIMAIHPGDMPIHPNPHRALSENLSGDFLRNRMSK